MNYEELIEFVRENLKKTVRGINRHIAVQFDIHGDTEGAFYVEIDGTSVKVVPYEYYDHDAKIITTTDELVKLLKGEKTPKDSIEEGITIVEGDLNSAAEMEKLFKAKKPVKKSDNDEKEIVETTKTKNNPIKKDILK